MRALVSLSDVVLHFLAKPVQFPSFCYGNFSFYLEKKGDFFSPRFRVALKGNFHQNMVEQYSGTGTVFASACFCGL